MALSVLQIPLSELASTREIVCCLPFTSIEQALVMMHERNVLSLPVLKNGEAAPGQARLFNGILNLVDLVNFCVYAVAESRMADGSVNLERLSLPVSDVTGSFGREGRSDWSFRAYVGTDTLQEVLYPFCAGVHRVLIWDEAAKREAVLSQMDILRYLVAQRGGLDAAKWRASAKRSSEPLVVRASTHSMLEAMRRACEVDKSAVGVIDDEGKLVANVSLSDLRGLTKESFAALYAPVLEFLAARQPDGALPELVALRAGEPGTTIGACAELMVSKHIHRVWLIDEAGRAVGHVSTTDVLAALALDDSVAFKTPEQA